MGWVAGQPEVLALVFQDPGLSGLLLSEVDSGDEVAHLKSKKGVKSSRERGASS